MASYPAPNPRNALYNQVDYVQNNFTDQEIQAKLDGKLNYNNAQGLETFGSGIVINGQGTSNGLFVSNSGVDTIPNFQINSTATLAGTNINIGAGMAASSYNPMVQLDDAVITYGIAGGTNSGRLDICPVGTTGGVYFDSNGIAHAQYPIGATANDNTLATTAFVVSQGGGGSGVKTNQNNTFLQPYIQSFTCSPTVSNTTAPFQLLNSTSTESASLYIDPTPNADVTLYSGQTNGGLTVRNVNGYSFTVNPSTPNNTAAFLNPISTNASMTSASLVVSGSTATVNTYNIATEGRNNNFLGVNNFNTNLGGFNTSGQGLTIGRNNKTGYNEVDLMSINPTTNYGLNFYAETTTVTPTTVPKLTIYNDTTPALLNAGLTIASGASNPINLFTGNFQGQGSNLQTSGNFVAGGTLTVYNNNPTTPHWSNITCPNLNLEVSTGLAITTVGQTNQVVLGTSASGLTVDDGIVATGSVTATSLTLSSGANSSVITTTSSGLNIADPVVCNSLTTSGSGSITTSGVLQLNTGTHSVQLGCSSLGNELVVGGDLLVNGNINGIASLVTTGAIQGGSIQILSGSNFSSTANLGGITTNATGLNLGRNNQVGNNEFDIICINPTTSTALNIYGSQSAVNNASVPIISFQNVGGTTVSNNQIQVPAQGAYPQANSNNVATTTYVNQAATAATTNLFYTYSFNNSGTYTFNYGVTMIENSNTAIIFCEGSQFFPGFGTPLSFTMTLPNTIYPNGKAGILSGGNAYVLSTTGQAVGMTRTLLNQTQISFVTTVNCSAGSNYSVAFNLTVSF